MTNSEILDRYQKLIDKNIKRCKDVDITISKKRRKKIKLACINTIIWEQGEKLDLNLMFLLHYGLIIRNMDLSRPSPFSKIPKETSNLYHQSLIIPISKNEAADS